MQALHLASGHAAAISFRQNLGMTSWTRGQSGLRDAGQASTNSTSAWAQVILIHNDGAAAAESNCNYDTFTFKQRCQNQASTY